MIQGAFPTPLLTLRDSRRASFDLGFTCRSSLAPATNGRSWSRSLEPSRRNPFRGWATSPARGATGELLTQLAGITSRTCPTGRARHVSVSPASADLLRHGPIVAPPPDTAGARAGDDRITRSRFPPAPYRSERPRLRSAGVRILAPAGTPKTHRTLHKRSSPRDARRKSGTVDCGRHVIGQQHARNSRVHQVQIAKWGTVVKASGGRSPSILRAFKGNKHVPPAKKPHRRTLRRRRLRLVNRQRRFMTTSTCPARLHGGRAHRARALRAGAITSVPPRQPRRAAG